MLSCLVLINYTLLNLTLDGGQTQNGTGPIARNLKLKSAEYLCSNQLIWNSVRHSGPDLISKTRALALTRH